MWSMQWPVVVEGGGLVDFSWGGRGRMMWNAFRMIRGDHAGRYRCIGEGRGWEGY